MRSRRLVAGVLCLAVLCLSGAVACAQVGQQQTAAVGARRASLAGDYGKLPLSFEANRGQVDSRVRFTSRGHGYSLFLTDREAVLALSKGGVNKSGCPILGGSCIAAKDGTEQTSRASPKTDVVRMQLAGAAAGLKVSGEEQLPGTANYFIGSDPAKWHSGVPTYSRVKYAGVYPGVDLVYYGNQRQLEYDFVVAPGADPKQVKLHFAGASSLKMTSDGDLMVVGKNGKIAFHKPVVYQLTEALPLKPTLLNWAPKREIVKGKFVLLAGNTVGFSLGDYDKGRELVIDPTLEYSTYLGGSGGSDGSFDDNGTAVAVDAEGNAYVVGLTWSTDFPVKAGSYDVTAYPGDTDGFITSVGFVSKISSAGTTLVYSTYLGGNGSSTYTGNSLNAGGGDGINAIALDSSGNAYLVGGTWSQDFPTTAGAYQRKNNAFPYGFNAFVTKLNASGTQLLYSTFLGGTGGAVSGGNNAHGDIAQAIAINASGNAYVTGFACSKDFPTKNPLQATNKAFTNNAADGFVAELNPQGTNLVYSTYLGGSGNPALASEVTRDNARTIALDASGDAFIAGWTYSQDFPHTSGALQTTNKEFVTSGETGFVAKINPAGSALLYSTYLGGANGNDSIGGIVVDTSGAAYVAGPTSSHSFPFTTGAFQTNNKNSSGYFNGFVSKLNPTGNALVYSTYLGGTGNELGVGDQVYAIAVDVSGDAYVTGFAHSKDFPLTAEAYQSTNKGYAANQTNAVLTQLNAAGSALLYSTYLGGIGSQNGGDRGNGVALDSVGGVYLVGQTYSSSFPTKGALQSTNHGFGGDNANAFIAKFTFATAGKITLTSDGNPEPVGAKVTFTAAVTSIVTGVIPTGTVSFAIDKQTPVVVTLDDTGHAAYSTTALAAGVHSVLASYSGDVLNLSSTSSALSETIYGPATTLAVVSGTPQTTVYGSAFAQPLVVVAKDSAGDVVPNIDITFGGTGLKFSSTTVVTGANGEASVTATAEAAGSLMATAFVTGTASAAKRVTFALTGTKAAFTVTATPEQMTYGAAVPALQYTITGHVNGDGASATTGTPVLSTTATSTSPVGKYPIAITQGTLAAANYSFVFVNGSMTVNKAAVASAEPDAKRIPPSETPYFSPAAGIYPKAETVSIIDYYAGGRIYYTTDGTTPTAASPRYTGPISVGKTETVKAIDVFPSSTSGVASGVYTIR